MHEQSPIRSMQKIIKLLTYIATFFKALGFFRCCRGRSMKQLIAICPVCKNQVIGDHYLCPGVFNAWRYIGNSKSTPLTQDILYHYTTIDTFKAILNSKILRGTKYSQLNDWQEVKIGIQKIKECLNKFEIDNSIKTQLFATVSDISQKRLNCFITSFSTQEDLLSQWRAYTDSKNGGLAIGFKGSKFHHFESESCSLLPCSYTNQEGQINLDQILSYLLKGYRNELKASKGIVRIQNYLPLLIQIATTIKHYGYYEEQEWRLITIEDDTAKIQTASETRIKFVTHKINPAMIDHVVISPHGDRKKLRKEISKLKIEGLLPKECEVRDSLIPYRGKTFQAFCKQVSLQN